MSMEKTLKEILDEILDEVEQELEEATTTAGVDGYQTPFAFGSGRKKDKKKEKDVATQAGYTLAESINEGKKRFYQQNGIGRAKYTISYHDGKSKHKDGSDFYGIQIFRNQKDLEKFRTALLKKGYREDSGYKNESVNEAKVKRPVNRWLELKNDETMHPHKKMAMGLKELKYQLKEVEKFFSWYNKIKTMNELDSQNYWKRTNNHIYTIKEKLIKIAKTIQEIEK